MLDEVIGFIARTSVRISRAIGTMILVALVHSHVVFVERDKVTVTPFSDRNQVCDQVQCKARRALMGRQRLPSPTTLLTDYYCINVNTIL